MARFRLYELVAMESPEAVREEVIHLLGLIVPGLDPAPVSTAFADVKRLFAGSFPGYRGCNTRYHDIKHTTDTTLATARLFHGARVAGNAFSARELTVALVAAVFHDAGYIQQEADSGGTGAKYTACHVERSVEFVGDYFAAHGFSAADWEVAGTILRCTGLNVDVGALAFPNHSVELLGKMLGAGDLLGQMADETYVEKLLFLYREFKEGGIGDYTGELDLLAKTAGFHAMTTARMARDLSGVNRYMRDHFRERWGIDEDLYETAVARHMTFLRDLVENHADDFLEQLRHRELVEEYRRRWLNAG